MWTNNIPFLLLKIDKMHGTLLTSDSDKRLAVWTACERDNIPIGAASQRNGPGRARGPGHVIDIEYLARTNDEFRSEVGGESAQGRFPR